MRIGGNISVPVQQRPMKYVPTGSNRNPQLVPAMAGATQQVSPDGRQGQSCLWYQSLISSLLAISGETMSDAHKLNDLSKLMVGGQS